MMIFFDSLKTQFHRYTEDVSDYFIPIPELDLTDQEREYLLQHYLKHKDQDVYYIAQDGTHDGNVWNATLNPFQVSFLKERVSRITVEWRSYFHLQNANSIVEAHKDENRFAVLNIAVQNVLETPTLWFKETLNNKYKTPIFETHYGEKAFLLNVKKVHEVRNNNPHLRLMYQLNFPFHSYEQIKQLYLSKKLFR